MVCLLGMVLILGVSLLINTSAFKTRLSHELQQRSGRVWRFEGELLLELVPAPRLRASHVRVTRADDETEQPLLYVDKVRLQLQLDTLVQQGAVVFESVLSGAELYCIKDAQGQSNWRSELVPTDASAVSHVAIAQQIDRALAAFAFVDLRLENARITWQDLGAGRKLELQKLNLRLDHLGSGVSSELALDFVAQFATAAAQQRLVAKANASLYADAAVVQVQNGLLHTVWSNAENGGQAELNWRLMPLQIDRVQQQLKPVQLLLSGSSLTAQLEMHGQDLFTAPQFWLQGQVPAFNLRAWLTPWIGQHALREAALQQVGLDFSVHVQPTQVELTHFALLLDAAHLNAAASMTWGAVPQLEFNATVDHLNLDNYISQDSTSPPITPMMLMQRVVAGFATVQQWRAAVLNGVLKVDRLAYADMLLQGMVWQIRSQHGQAVGS